LPLLNFLAPPNICAGYATGWWCFTSLSPATNLTKETTLHLVSIAARVSDVADTETRAYLDCRSWSYKCFFRFG